MSEYTRFAGAERELRLPLCVTSGAQGLEKYFVLSSNTHLYMKFFLHESHVNKIEGLEMEDLRDKYTGIQFVHDETNPTHILLFFHKTVFSPAFAGRRHKLNWLARAFKGDATRSAGWPACARTISTRQAKHCARTISMCQSKHWARARTRARACPFRLFKAKKAKISIFGLYNVCVLRSRPVYILPNLKIPLGLGGVAQSAKFWASSFIDIEITDCLL